MATLNDADSVDSGDRFVIWKTNDSQYEGATLQEVATAIQPLITVNNAFSTQYAVPSGSGQTVTVVAGSSGQSNIQLYIQPLAGYSAMTVLLPLASLCVDGQMLRVLCTQSVTTLTTSLNGAVGAIGVPTTLAANAFYTLRFDLPSQNWYRVA